MALILLDASGTVCGLGTHDAQEVPPWLAGLALGEGLGARLQGPAAAGQPDAAALQRGLAGLQAGQWRVFEHRHGPWRLGLQACAPGSAAACILTAVREAEPAEWQRQQARLEDLLVSRTVQLAEASERADAAGRERSRFLAQASHQVRTPLNIIVSQAHLLAGGLADPGHRRRVQAIEQAARQLGELFDGLLAVSLGQSAPAAAGPAAAAPEADALRALRQRHAGRHVLLAEDDDISQLAMVELLSAAGLEVVAVDDGHEAVVRACSAAPDLVLLDLRMPRLDGIATARTLRTLPGLQATPILALSANASDADRQACRAAGMDDFLPKPVDVARLYQRLLHWLDARHATGPEAAPAPGRAAAPATDDPALSALFGLEGLDAARGLAAVGGRADVYRRLLRVFAQTHAGDGAPLRHHVAAGDRAAAAAVAHRLRGSAATLGLVDVETAAATLESMVESGADVAALSPQVRAVEQALADILAGLEAVLEA